MKNACIVLRNNRIPLNGQEFEGGISALLQGGYAADKVYILSQSDPHEFMQTAVECKNFFDNVLVFCEESSLAGVRAKVCEILKVEQSAASVIRADSKAFFCLPFGETGAGIVIDIRIVSGRKVLGAPCAVGHPRGGGSHRTKKGAPCPASQYGGHLRL